MHAGLPKTGIRLGRGVGVVGVGGEDAVNANTPELSCSSEGWGGGCP